MFWITIEKTHTLALEYYYLAIKVARDKYGNLKTKYKNAYYLNSSAFELYCMASRLNRLKIGRHCRKYNYRNSIIPENPEHHQILLCIFYLLIGKNKTFTALQLSK